MTNAAGTMVKSQDEGPLDADLTYTKSPTTAGNVTPSNPASNTKKIE